MKWLPLSILIALALLLSAESPHPSPGETEQRNRQREGVNPNSETDNQPAKPIAVQRAGEASNQQKQSDEIRASDNKKPSRVIVVSAVDVRKDWVDRSFAFFSFLLVIVGAFQIALLGRMRRETRASERAWVAFEMGKVDGLKEVFALWDDPGSLNSEMMIIKIVTANYFLTNSGKTPAHVDAAGVLVKVVKVDGLPEEPNCAGIDEFPLVKPPGRPNRGCQSVALVREHIDNLRSDKYAIMIYGIVRYRDVFRRDPHQSRFCVLGRRPPGGKGIMFKIGGPKAYNRYT